MRIALVERVGTGVLVGVLALSGLNSGCARRHGFVVLMQATTVAGGTTVVRSYASAVFNGGLVDCSTQAVIGPCRVVACPRSNSSSGERVPVSAGTITISGGALASPFRLSPSALMPDSLVVYQTLEGPTRFWNDGQTVRVQSTGATGGVPMFDQTVTGPPAIEVTAPTFVAGTPVRIPRDAPLDVTWTGGSSGTVKIEVTAPPGGGAVTPWTQAVCSFAAPLGTGTIPSDVLTMLPAGGGTIAVVNESEATVGAGDYDIVVRANQQAAASGATFE
jgi:hypothetical protein